MRKQHLLGFTAMALVLGMTKAGATVIDFTVFPYSTPVTTVDGVTFALDGLPDSSGVPSTLSSFYAPFTVTLDNTNSGGYPTANSLDVTFSSPVNDLSFNFWNYGTAAPSSYSAYNSGGGVVATGSLQFATSSALINVAGTGIKELVFDNNFGSSSYQFGIGKISFAPISAVPEPTTLSLVGIGLAGLGFVRRRKRA